jgi:hypothetical protein
MMVAELYRNRWQVASISLTETLPLNQLFGKPNSNIVNELDESSESTLFLIVKLI